MKIGLTASYPMEKDKPLLSLGLIAAYVEQECGFSVDISDNIKDFVDYDIIGVSSYTPGFNKAVNMLRQVNGVKVIGGAHPSSIYRYVKNGLMSVPEDIDFYVAGDGESGMKQIVDYYSGKVKKPPKWIFADPIMFLDSLPDPKLCDYYGRIHSGRGCCFKCFFCTGGHLWNKARYKSADKIADEIEVKYKRGIRHFSISEDLFLINMPRLHKLMQILDKKGILHDIAFSEITGRADYLTDDVIGQLSEWGIREIFSGFEHCNPRILKILKDGPKVHADNHQRVLNLCSKHKVYLFSSFIFGTPTETMEEMQEVYDFVYRNRDNRFHIPNRCYNLSYYPGTAAYDYAVENGYFRYADPPCTSNASFNSNDFKWNSFRYLNDHYVPREEYIAFVKKYLSMRVNETSMMQNHEDCMLKRGKRQA